MEVLYEDLKKLKLFNSSDKNQGGKIYIKDNVLYKLFTDYYSFYDEIIRNIDFQISNHIINTPQIYDKIFAEGRCTGYTMEYISNSITFKKAIYKNINKEVKLKSIYDVYKALKHLHSYNICLGDIHLDNMLISNNGNGYLIDLDYLVFPGDEFKYYDKYLVRLNNKSYSINKESKYIDNIKTMLCSLSLLLNTNLEDFMDDYVDEINIEELYNNYISNLKLEYLNRYFKDLINGEKVTYFDDILSQEYNIYKEEKPKILQLVK